MRQQIPFVERAFVSVEESAEFLGPGHGRTTVFALLANGRLRSVKVGRLRAVDVQSLIEYAAQLRQASLKAA